MSDVQGYFSIVLHAHLPYVRHPEHERFLEEEWFYEALTETYIPLLKVFESLASDGVRFRVTLSLTPTLLSMMTDPLLQDRYVKHLDRLIELAKKEIDRNRWDAKFRPLSEMYHRLFLEARHFFCEKWKKNITLAFKSLQDQGFLEIMTCAATHGFLPLMESQPAAVRAQIAVGVQTHRRILGRSPRGIWLPECGFYPGVDEFLKEQGIQFFIADSHALTLAEPAAKYGVHAPAFCPSGVAVFARDEESSKSVWSSKEGYPGDFDYREFYRDIGFDLDYDYMKPYLNGDGARINTGLKYYRITGTGNNKEPYNPSWAQAKALSHAGNFMFNREKQIRHLSGQLGRPPLIVSPYDAELFGHWWFEGPMWLDFLFRKIHFDTHAFQAITPVEYLEKFPYQQKVTPSMSSWGYKGYAEVWLNETNDWIYPLLYDAAERMTKAADRFQNAGDLERRVLNQMSRELLLAQSSDWAFILKTGTHTEYAAKRTKDHLGRFDALLSGLEKNLIDTQELERIESTDNIFPDLRYQIYQSNKELLS